MFVEPQQNEGAPVSVRRRQYAERTGRMNARFSIAVWRSHEYHATKDVVKHGIFTSSVVAWTRYWATICFPVHICWNKIAMRFHRDLMWTVRLIHFTVTSKPELPDPKGPYIIQEQMLMKICVRRFWTISFCARIVLHGKVCTEIC